MSADTIDQEGGRSPRDPHDIVPDGFLARFPEAETIREALQLAERDPSTTDPDSQPRCPYCGNTKIKRKTAWTDHPNEKAEGWKCDTGSCGEHFEEPAPPIEEEIGRQVTLSEVDGV